MARKFFYVPKIAMDRQFIFLRDSGASFATIRACARPRGPYTGMVFWLSFPGQPYLHHADWHQLPTGFWDGWPHGMGTCSPVHPETEAIVEIILP